MNHRGKSLYALSLSLCLFSPQLMAQWTLNNELSSLYYVSHKASAISEINTFGALSGSIDEAGLATLRIELASVDTAIELRDERMRDIFFKVASFPLAVATLNVDPARLEAMATGESYAGAYEVSLDLHGLTRTMPAELQVSRLSGGGLQVHLLRPLILNAASFGLAGGVEELRQIAALPSINSNVVVNFTLRFDES